MAAAGPGARRHATSSFTVSSSEYAELQATHGLPPPGPAPSLSRRGSFVHTIPYADAGPHNEPGYMVHVVHSARTEAQLEHRARVDEFVAGNGGTSRTRAQAEQSRSTYQEPAFPKPPADVGHQMRVQTYSADRDGFHPVGGPRTYESGDFSHRDRKELEAMKWPGETPEQRHHSEPRWAMDVRSESAAAHPQYHSVVGGLDMCTTCRAGLSATIAKSDGSPVAYVGREPFGSQGEWAATPGHTVPVPGSSITRVRPETVMTNELRQEHVGWADYVYAKRIP